MSEAMQSVADFVKAARAAILAGNLDEAETLTKQAQALKAVDGLEPPAETKTVDTSQRLPFPAGDTSEAETAEDIAVKSWYARRFGDSASAMDQVMSELYGRDHRRFSWAKSADFVRYIRTGQYDSQLHRAMVYSPSQVEGFMQLGMSVKELKATQVESQDQLGRLKPAA